MLGIRGLDPFGLIHSVFGLVALAFGLAVVARRKGTMSHRRLGRLYLGSMVGLNGTSFLIYDLFGVFGPFHIAALFSLGTLVAGWLPVLLRRPRRGWLEVHGYLMSWSLVGLVAAFVAEIGVRIPGAPFGPVVIGGTILVMILGGLTIHTSVPKIARTLVAGAVGVRAAAVKG
jgi:uncharacterized membrane protein